MSFMSGVMMGLSIGGSIHDVMAGKKKAAKAAQAPQPGKVQEMPATAAYVLPEFALVSRLQGRRRYVAASLVGNVPLSVLLEKQLTRLSQVQSVKANAATGSILIQYTGSEPAMDKIMEKVENMLVPVDASGQQAPKHGSNLPAPTVYANSWSSTGSFLNAKVRQLTGNAFDIPALVSLIFLIRGIRKMLVYGERPTGPSMIWWALHLMKGW